MRLTELARKGEVATDPRDAATVARLARDALRAMRMWPLFFAIWTAVQGSVVGVVQGIASGRAAIAVPATMLIGFLAGVLMRRIFRQQEIRWKRALRLNREVAAGRGRQAGAPSP